MLSDLEEYLRERRSLIETELAKWLQPVAGCPASLTEAMGYSLLAPGKRLRPVLSLLACEASGGKAENAIPAGCAVEMIHTYSLIHDDLPAMDDDDTRRGRPTSHKQFGEGMAILAGDALLTLAFQVLAEGLPPRTAAACCGELARAAGCAGMIGGQVDDLAWEKQEQSSSELAELEFLHARKTGALIQAGLCLGVHVAQGECPDGPEPQLLDRFREYGRCLGLAFQIVDDLLDVEGNPEELGKGILKDANRGKLTYPGLLGIEESRRRATELCERAGQCVEPLGAPGERLRQLAGYVLQRQR